MQNERGTFMAESNEIEYKGRKSRLNNYYMRGDDGFNRDEKVAVNYSDQNTSVHMHDFIEIVYFTSGVGTHYIDGKMYNVSPGCVCVMNNNVKHYYGVDGAYCKKLAVKNIIFSPEFLGCGSDNFLSEYIDKKLGIKLGEKNQVSFYHLLNDPDKEIEKCFSMIEKEMKMKKDNYLQVVRSLVEVILLLLVSERESRIEGRRYNKSYMRIEESIEFLNKNIKNVPSMKKIAKEYGFSAEYYSKLFREFTGKSYIQFVQEMKCDEACRLLLETDYTNEAIAELSGFSSLKHFYQQFKKCKGITPREYIKQNL